MENGSDEKSMIVYNDIEMTPQIIITQVADIKRHLGQELIDIVTGRGDFAQQNSLLNYHRDRAKGHPLTSLWLDLEKEVIRTGETGVLSLSFKSMILLEGLYSLIDAKLSGLWPEILPKLLNETQFYSTLFEVEIWKKYKIGGFDALLLAESTERTPDIKIKQDEHCIYVECKSLQDVPKKEKNAWDNICAQILKIFWSHKRWWRVHVMMKSRLSGVDAASIIGNIKLASQYGHTTEQNIEDRIFIEYEVITNSDFFLPGPLLTLQTKEIFWMEATGVFDESGSAFNKSPRIVEITPYFEFNPHTQVLGAIKTAAAQLPREKGGLVHIEIPYRDGERILEVTDNIYDVVCEQIEKNFRRVNAVIFSSKRTNNNPRSGDDAINHHYVVIPNKYAYTNLPPGIKVLGASSGNSEIEASFFSLSTEGTIFISLEEIGDISEQIGRYFIYICSSNGRQQLKFWRDYRSNLVIELINDHSGRRKIVTAAVDFCNLPVTKLAISWSADFFCAIINHKLLEYLVECPKA